ncbi:MAG: TIGR01459 family HAD-type hydrolase [Alphaproteobacteria bacterium]|nr:MAG: TIGR01459 family HAD-type hydrolase [Alphaproteobacteria bacterium]
MPQSVPHEAKTQPCHPQELPGLRAVDGCFRALICDVWGVITDGVTLFAEAKEALARFHAERGPVALLTNSARPGRLVARRLADLGLPMDIVDAVVTAGDCARAIVADRFEGRRLAHVGPDFDRPILADLPARLVADPRSAEALLVTGPISADIAAHRSLLEEPARRRIPLICANPDRWVRYGARRIPCAGLLADLYEELGGPVIHAGKPAAFCFHEAARRLGFPDPASRAAVLVAGDGLQTDIRGAQAAGMASLWLRSGLHADELQDGEEALFEKAQACPDYVMDRLHW